MDSVERVDAAAAFLRASILPPPTVGVVLGSGLGRFAERVEDAVVLPYEQIPHWPPARVIGHAGQLVAGRVAGRRLVVLSGRAHYYEGHSLDAVVFGVRVLARLGVGVVVLTNAAGGIAPALDPGTLMVIDDHVNLMGANPLMGPNDERFGPRFPDMTDAYSRRLRDIADRAAAEAGIRIAHGIYAAVHGPSYETPAEIRMLRLAGADLVGMSMVPEVIVAVHGGATVLGMSVVTDLAVAEEPEPLSHEIVVRAAQEAAPRVGAIVGALVEGEEA
jgi:purine-nucleoside phosphorylase